LEEKIVREKNNCGQNKKERAEPAKRAGYKITDPPARVCSFFFYAAEAAAALSFFRSESPSQRTLTSFETPGSCMVTP
jgi:hypothetical protein